VTEAADQEHLREGLKRVAVLLKESGRAFALTGGYAAWVHGAPEPGHDVDFLARPEDADALAAHLAERGLEVSQPPEDWLFKVHTDGVVVDVLHRASGTTPEAALERATSVPVLSVVMPVVAPTDLVAEKLLALDEHYCDLAALLPTLRAVREKVDWGEVRKRVEGHPFAEATIFLLERLEVIG
jgi:hypothetical protein